MDTDRHPCEEEDPKGSHPHDPGTPPGMPDGIISAAYHPAIDTVEIGYDPGAASASAVDGYARVVAPFLKSRFEKCIFRLQGRACEACALRLEDKARRIDGVQRARATFIGGVMSVTFDPAVLPAEEVAGRVRATGAPVAAIDEAAGPDYREAAFTVATLVLMVTGWVLDRQGAPSAVVAAVYTGAYLAGGYYGFFAGLRSLRQWTIDVDILMILAALGAAYVGAPFEGAMLLFLFSLSNVLQSFAVDRARNAIRSLMELRPQVALVRRGEALETVAIETLVPGDRVVVRPGERVPVDGRVHEGESFLDESAVTGESMPVAKSPGSPIYSGSINQSGSFEMEVTRLAADSLIARLVRMVEEAQTEKASAQLFLDRAEQYYAVGVLSLTALLIVVPPLLGEPFAAAFYRAMTAMVVASPCALIISTPASILSAIGGAARRGVLFKGGVHMERLATVTTIAFDKTGTLTVGKPAVTGVHPAGDLVEADFLATAAGVESRSEHPLARAIVAEAEARKIAIPDVSGFEMTAGKGASARLNGDTIVIGNEPAMQAAGIPIPAEVITRAVESQQKGRTVVFVGRAPGNPKPAALLGFIALGDTIRPDAAAMLGMLRDIGVQRFVILTGDNERVARAVGAELGITDVRAGLLPEHKVTAIRQLAAEGPIALAGDGVNDAPALASATVGIAMGAAGTDVAMETADIVLMSNNLVRIPYAVGISRMARRVVIQNLAFAMGVIVLLLITTLIYPLPLPLGVVGHEGSTVLVCLNGLRLLFADPTAKTKPS